MMTLEHASLPDRSVRYHAAGSGRTLILLHAFPLNADQWLPQIASVPPGWRFIAPDSATEPASPDATMATLAANVVALMDHLDVGRAVVAGLSMGGYVALELARSVPERLDGLVLADTKAGADDEAGRAARDEMIALVTEKGPAAIADKMVSKLLGETSRRERPELEGRVRSGILQNTAGGIASAVRAMKGRADSRPLLPRIACPTLIVCGEEDVLTPPALSEAMAAAIPDAQLVLLPGIGHLSNLEAPTAFSSALRRFLSKVP